MALEKRALVDVKVPIGDADGEVAEREGCDVDAAGDKTVALHRREGSIVPDDFGDRIRRRHVASSAIVRDARPDTRSRFGLTQVVSSRRDAPEEALDLGILAIKLVDSIVRRTRKRPSTRRRSGNI